MFKIKTPHRNNAAHLLRFSSYFGFACVFVGILLQSKLSFPWFGTLGALLITTAISSLGGLFFTIVLRWCFDMIQTGRILQWLCFWLGAYLGVRASTALLPDCVWHCGAGITSLLIVFVAFAGAIWLKEVPWKGRSWFPQYKKRSHKRHVVGEHSSERTSGTHGSGKKRSQTSIALTRAALGFKAGWLGMFGGPLRAQMAWHDLVDFEKQHLPAESSGRSNALTELALSYLASGDAYHVSLAKQMLTTAHHNLVKDYGNESVRVGCTLQLLGRVEQQLDNWDGACKLHQAAEGNFQFTAPVGYTRANNLTELSRCYAKVGQQGEAAKCHAEAEELYKILRSRPARMMPPH